MGGRLQKHALPRPTSSTSDRTEHSVPITKTQNTLYCPLRAYVTFHIVALQWLMAEGALTIPKKRISYDSQWLPSKHPARAIDCRVCVCSAAVSGKGYVN